MGASLVLFSQITCYFLSNALVDAKPLTLVCRLVKFLMRHRWRVQHWNVLLTSVMTNLRCAIVHLSVISLLRF